MGLREAAILIGIVSASVCIALFGHIPALRHTPIGYIYRFFKRTLPHAILSTDKRLTGGAITGCLYDSGMFLATEKHPVIVIFYVFLITGGIGVFMLDSYAFLPARHQLLAPLICLLPYITLYKAIYSDPGTITPTNHSAAMTHYPFDHMLFFPGTTCRTCRFVKPARSKHCSICRRCISKMDHHCVWINNCVGRNNTLHFLAFLLATSLLLIYGAWQSAWVITQFVNSEIPPNYPKELIPWTDYITIWTSWMLDLPYTGSIFLLSLLTSLLAVGFTCYHLYLIYAGTTTNESSKWSDWSDDIRASLSYPSPTSPSAPPPPGIYIATKVPPEYAHLPPGLLSGNMAENERSARLEDKGSVNWPKRGEKYYARVEFPEETDERGEGWGGVLPKGEWGWERLEGLEPVENLYDLGFGANLKKVIWPDTV